MSDTADTGQMDRMGQARDPLFALPRFQHALRELEKNYNASGAVSIVIGAEGSGRRRLLHALANRLQPHVASAMVSATETRENHLLSSIFGQFGYDFSSQIQNELTGMLRVFAVHQADLGYRPVVGIMDAEKCSHSLAAILSETLTIRSARKPALNLVLAGSLVLEQRLACDDLVELHLNAAKTLTLGGLNEAELCGYIDARYGIDELSSESVAKILEATGGSVTAIDSLLQRTDKPAELDGENDRGVDTTHYDDSKPTLFLSQTGTLLDQIVMDRPRFLIGRAEHNDITLDSRYISRHHALIVAGPADSHWLVDLNSRNGTFVNSRAVDYIALRDNDIVIMGNHRLKYQNKLARGKRPDRSDFAGGATAVFQTLSADTPANDNETIISQSSIQDP